MLEENLFLAEIITSYLLLKLRHYVDIKTLYGLLYSNLHFSIINWGKWLFAIWPAIDIRSSLLLPEQRVYLFTTRKLPPNGHCSPKGFHYFNHQDSPRGGQ